jgi:hypothetical protein
MFILKQRLEECEKMYRRISNIKCESCGFDNVYIQCSDCMDWKLKLQEKPKIENL